MFPVVLLSAFAAPAAVAQYQTYPIYTNVSSVPAGSYGATIVASVNDNSATANFNVCFDTGYGSSKVPIVPYSYVSYGNFAQFNFDVPPATIQAVPPTAFVNGSFNVSIYSVPTSFTACNGNEPGAPQGNTLTLNYPMLNSVSLPNLPEQNTALTAREPSSIALAGSNFIASSGTSGKVPSAVNFIASTTLAGTVKFLNGNALRSTIPTTIPDAASSVAIQVCNTATYSYCSNSLPLKTVPLQANPGTLTASPSPAFTTQPVTLTATFGPAAHSTAGAPFGPVTFGYWGKTLGTANLVLDKTATFAQAPAQPLLTYALPLPPIVADFNGDGIPDTLFIDPGTSNSGSSLHLLLGTVPSGSFQADRQFYVLSDGPSFTISSAAVADVNGDGIPDIVLLATEPDYSTGLNLYTMLGNGDGTFQDGFSASPTLYGSQIVAGDFNKDGKQDIVIAGALDSDGTVGLQALLGDDKGNFTAGPATTGLRTAPSPYFGDFKVAAADFNADGYPDIAVMNGYSPSGQLDNSIEVYQNTGTAAFAAPVRVQTDGTATADFSIAALGPGLPLDIIVTSTGSGLPGVYVALNQSTTAKIAFFDTFQLTQVPGLTQAVFGDFDGDGLLDAAVDDQTTIHVLSGNGLGAFAANYPDLSIVPPGTTLIAASDENGDMYADLLLYTAAAQNSNNQYSLTLYDYVTSGTATAIFPPVTFPAGTQPLFASTNGTFDILPGKATATLIVTAPAASIVTLTASPASPVNYGTASVTLTASIPVANATGTVSFYNGTTLLGTGPLVDAASSTATYTIAAPAAGSYSFKAVYAGDTTHGAGTSAALPYTVNPVAATINWMPSPSTIVYGTPLSAAQLDATAVGIIGAAVGGTFTYSPALGTVLTAGTHSVTATFKPTDPNYATTTATQSITVTQATPTVTWVPNPATFTYGTPLSAAQLDATSSTPGTFTYTPALGTVLTAGTQTLSVVFTPTDSTDYAPVTKTAAITVTQATPVITWSPNPATITYGTALTAAELDASSNTPGTFTYTPGLGTILTAGSQTLSAVFTPTDTTDFKTTSATVNIVVTAATPAISWVPNPATISYGTALTAAQLDATSTTPGTFTYTPALATILTAGTETLSVLFTPADSVDFKSVTATASIVVTAVTPSVTWTPNPATIAYGTALSAAQLDATASTPGTFAYTPALGTVLAAGTQTLTTVFTPTDATDFKAVTAKAAIVVTAVTPAITWTPNPATITYGTPLSAAQLDATASTPGTFTYTPALGTILTVGTQTLKVTFTPTDSTDFTTAIATATITVTAATPAIAWTPNPATITYGTPLTAAQLDATSSTPGTFTYSTALGTVLTAGTQTLSAIFTPTDTIDFKSVTSTATITVTAAIPAVTWTPSHATITYGTGLTAAQLDATSSTPGTFTYTPALGTILTAGTQTLSALFTPTDAKDFKSVTSTATITVTAATPAVTWTPNPATIPYGTALSAAQLDATSSTPGTFAYNPAIGTVLSAGTQTLSALFIPTDAKDFNSVTSTATIIVSQAAPTITWAAPASIVAGTALSSTQLDAAATGVTGAALPGTFAYTPALGTILTAGTQTLKVVFTPADLANYTTATASVSLQVIPVTLTALSVTTAMLGDPAKTITLTGTGFVPTASVLVNGTAIPTTFVNATTLTAIVPAADFLMAQTLQISVTEPTQNQTTASLPLLVGAPPAAAVFSGPPTISPGSQTGLTFELKNAYPVDLTATFTLGFTPAIGLPNDPTIVFASGGTTYTAVIPANSTSAPSVQIQGGTVAGTISVDLTLEAGGVNVTPTSVQPLSIQAPLAAPGITSTALTRSGNTLTVAVRGFSNPRDMTMAKFHFAPANGGSIGTPDLTIDVGSLFTTWYADPASSQYGSAFTYTQVFNLSSDASVVGQVSVTLVNSVGGSMEASTP